MSLVSSQATALACPKGQLATNRTLSESNQLEYVLRLVFDPLVIGTCAIATPQEAKTKKTVTASQSLHIRASFCNGQAADLTVPHKLPSVHYTVIKLCVEIKIRSNSMILLGGRQITVCATALRNENSPARQSVGGTPQNLSRKPCKGHWLERHSRPDGAFVSVPSVPIGQEAEPATKALVCTGRTGSSSLTPIQCLLRVHSGQGVVGGGQ